MITASGAHRCTDLKNILLLSLAIFVTYLNATHIGVIPLDDGNLIKSITRFHSSICEIFSGNGEKYFRPLAFLSYVFDAKLFNADPVGIHFVNILIHVCNSILVYFVALRLEHGEVGRQRTAMVASLLFGLHPVNSEAVLWISSRYDLLSCFFFLASLLLIVRHESSNSFRPQALLFLLFLASLLSKEASMLLPVAAAVFIINERQTISRRRRETIMVSLLLSLMLYLYLRNGFNVVMDKGIGKSLLPSVRNGLGATLMQCLAAVGFYLKKMVYPFPLNFAISSIDSSKNLILFVLFFLTLTVLFVVRKDLRFAIALMATALIPPLFAMLGKLAWTPYAERYLYIPMVGFAFLISISFARHLKRVSPYLLLLPVLLLAVPTTIRVSTWADPVLFWKDSIYKSPRFGTPHLLFATELLRLGKLGEAEQHLVRGRELGFPRAIDEEYAEKLQTALADARKNK